MSIKFINQHQIVDLQNQESKKSTFVSYFRSITWKPKNEEIKIFSTMNLKKQRLQLLLELNEQEIIYGI